MKRNEAIELLKDLLNDSLNDRTGEIGYGYIVDGLIKAGFRPPAHLLPIQYHDNNYKQLQTKCKDCFENE